MLCISFFLVIYPYTKDLYSYIICEGGFMNNSDEYIESIYNMEEAFKRGNLFPELYTPYKKFNSK